MEVLGVEDHGVWRGRRTWTVRLRDKNGTAQVSAIDVDSREAAIAQAQETFAGRRIFTDAEREALHQSNQTIQRGLS